MVLPAVAETVFLYPEVNFPPSFALYVTVTLAAAGALLGAAAGVLFVSDAEDAEDADVLSFSVSDGTALLSEESEVPLPSDCVAAAVAPPEVEVSAAIAGAAGIIEMISESDSTQKRCLDQRFFRRFCFMSNIVSLLIQRKIPVLYSGQIRCGYFNYSTLL